MPTRYSSPLAVLLTVAVCFGATGRAAAQGNNEFRSMPLDQITRWLADSLPPATQLSYVRTDYDDEGTFRINAAIQVLSMRFAGCAQATCWWCRAARRVAAWPCSPHRSGAAATPDCGS